VLITACLVPTAGMLHQQQMLLRLLPAITLRCIATCRAVGIEALLQDTSAEPYLLQWH
jgi:hypothetical protein